MAGAPGTTSPDGTTSTARRTLFDRVGDTARQTGAFNPGTLPVAELVDLGPDHPAEYLPLTTIRHLSIATGGMAWPEPDTEAGQEAAALGFPARMYHVTRDVADDLSRTGGSRSTSRHRMCSCTATSCVRIRPGP